MQGRYFEAIRDRGENLAVFNLLREHWQRGAETFPEHLVGWQGGSRPFTVCWLPDLGFWSALERVPPDIKDETLQRFWNCFGIADPARQKILTITLEINPPHEEVNRRVAGLFARDGEDRVYIAHTGKVGGGRQGIGPKSFREHLEDHPWHEIKTRDGSRTAVVLGPIDAPDFPAQIAKYVYSVSRFKENVASCRKS